MFTALHILNYQIDVFINGGTNGAHQWRAHMAPYLSQRAPGESDEADLILFLELKPGWTNQAACSNLGLEYKDGKLLAINIEKPTVSGWIVRESNRFRGSFRVRDGDADFIDYVISTCLSFVCEERGMLLLHASAVVREGKAWLFLGEGGSGKTTIALELNGGGVPMSVDRTLVHVEENGNCLASSTPFSDRDFAIKEARSAPVGGIVFIEQADRHSVSRANEWETVGLLLKQTLFSSREPSSVSRLLSKVGQIAEQAMSYRMKFEKNDAFWSLIAHMEETKA